MPKPSTAFSWTTVATYRDTIPSGLRNSGFIPNTLVSSGYTNQALFEIGEWVTYLSDLSPADNVLAFREWECPDDSSYQLAWNGPAGVDGLFQGDVHSWSVLADTATYTAGFDAGSGDTATVTFNPSTSTGYLRTNATGWVVGVLATDPTTPADEAGITVDADSGDVLVYSDYGTITLGTASDTISIPGTVSADEYEYPSAKTFQQTWTPQQYADDNGNGANDITALSKIGWTVAELGTAAAGDVLCVAHLGTLLPTLLTGGSGVGTPSSATVFWQQVAGSSAVTLELVRVSAGGTETVVGSVTLPNLTSGPQSDPFGSLAGSSTIYGSYFLRAKSVGASASSIKVFGIDYQYTNANVR